MLLICSVCLLTSLLALSIFSLGFFEIGNLNSGCLCMTRALSFPQMDITKRRTAITYRDCTNTLCLILVSICCILYLHSYLGHMFCFSSIVDCMTVRRLRHEDHVIVRTKVRSHGFWFKQNFIHSS